MLQKGVTDSQIILQMYSADSNEIILALGGNSYYATVHAVIAISAIYDGCTAKAFHVTAFRWL
jgi:diphthamide biosynthesis methyltransferase